MLVSLYRAIPGLVAALLVVSASTSASAAPGAAFRVGTFGGGHFGRPGTVGFHPNFGRGFIAGEHFWRGRDRFFGGFGGDFGVYAPGVGGDYGQYPAVGAGATNVNQTELSVVVNSPSDALMAGDSGLHGDCVFHKLIYSPNGRYLGQRTSRACY